MPSTFYRPEVFAGLDPGSAAALEVLLMEFRRVRPGVHAHCVRVASLAIALGRALRLASPALAELARGALLHDLGKTLIADALLNKTGLLTAAEMEVLRRHPQLGHDLLASVPGLGHVALTVLHSHERFDGRGYPFGQAGSAISIDARVTALVDAFDAMTESRPYRRPVSVAQACAELVRGAGTQFDPEIVSSWLRLLDEHEIRVTVDLDGRRAGTAYEAIA